MPSPLLRQGDGFFLYSGGIAARRHGFNGAASRGVIVYNLTPQVGAFAATFLSYSFCSTCRLPIFSSVKLIWGLTFFAGFHPYTIPQKIDTHTFVGAYFHFTGASSQRKTRDFMCTTEFRRNVGAG